MSPHPPLQHGGSQWLCSQLFLPSTKVSKKRRLLIGTLTVNSEGNDIKWNHLCALIHIAGESSLCVPNTNHHTGRFRDFCNQNASNPSKHIHTHTQRKIAFLISLECFVWKSDMMPMSVALNPGVCGPVHVLSCWCRFWHHFLAYAHTCNVFVHFIPGNKGTKRFGKCGFPISPEWHTSEIWSEKKKKTNSTFSFWTHSQQISNRIVCDTIFFVCQPDMTCRLGIVSENTESIESGCDLRVKNT